MVNLLPREVQQKFWVLYYVRLASLLVFLLAVSVTVGSALLLPSYFLARDEANAARRYLSAVEETTGIRERLGAAETITTLAERVSILKQFKRTPSIGRVMQELTAPLPKGVALYGIAVRPKEEGKGDVAVGGVADSRAALISYVESLQGSASFSGVSIPVAQLANETDFEFSLTFNYQTQ